MKRTEGLHPRAGAIAGLLDAVLPIQTQHAKKRGTPIVALCGSHGGQIATLDIGITCEDCRRLLKRRARRGQ